MTPSERIAFVGGGNMATALIQGLLTTGTARAEQLVVSDARAQTLAALRERFAIATTGDNLQACSADVIVLSVKPQVFPALLPQLAPALGADKLVVSIAAGVPLAAIEARLPDARVVRAMPNTPALASAGATALAAGRRATPQDRQRAQAIFASVGAVVEVADEQMDAVTALSGSGPAYVFLLAEALIDAGVRAGLSREVATALVHQTVFGAGKLLATGSEPATQLRRKVTSPGGTTEAGLAQLEAHGLRAAIEACVHAACERGAQLGAEAAAKLAAERS